MKTDRELLELAAKSIGIDIFFSNEWHDKGECYFGDRNFNYPWNPLTDDGDALRILSKLYLSLIVDTDDIHILSVGGDLIVSIAGDGNGVNDQMVRFAIVSAAAEIGEAME